MSESRGRSSETSFRLCSRAPRMISCSVTASPAVRKAPDGRRGRVGRVSSPGRTHVRPPGGGYHGSHDLIRHRQVRRVPADPGHRHTGPMNAPADLPGSLERLHQSEQRLLLSVDSLGAEAWTGASVLPGWSRAHVAAHLALNAEALAA